MNKSFPTSHKPYDAVESALSLCIDAHGGQIDDDGNLKFIHIFSVAARAKDTDELIVALLHDSLEDSPEIVSLSMLKRLFGSKLAAAIQILTRRDKQRYEEYIDEIINSGNELAMRVKVYDLEHNLSRNTKGPKFENRWIAAREKILEKLPKTPYSIPIHHGDIQLT